MKIKLEKYLKITLEIAAVVIALSAFIIAYQQGKIQREHNEVSVEPRLSSYFSNDGDKNQWGLFLINNGLGTAYIEELKVFVDKQEIEQSEMGPFAGAIKQLGLNIMCFKFAKGPKNHSLQVGFEYFWIQAKKESPKSCARSKILLMDALSKERLTYRLKFKSIYGVEFEYKFSKNQQKKL